MESQSAYINLLKGTKFSPLFKDFNKENICKIDLSTKNQELFKRDVSTLEDLQAYINNILQKANRRYGVGGYLENRIIYQKSALFGAGEDARTIHLGIDIWCEAGTQIHCPFKGKVHGFDNNDNFKDYGPTIILEHRIEDTKFYTLYGHLSKYSLQNLFTDKEFEAGEVLAEVGDSFENGTWPPHLHFQIIKNINGYIGDFPGVVNKQEVESFRENCPDPELILRINS